GGGRVVRRGWRRGARAFGQFIPHWLLIYRHACDDERAFQYARRSHPPRDLRTAVPPRRADRAGPDREGRCLATRGLQAPPRPQACPPGARPARGPGDPLQRRAARSGAADQLDGPLRRCLPRSIGSPRTPAEAEGPMPKATDATRSIVMEGELPPPPEKVWRALTQGALIEEWLMKNDFQPVVGHKFNFR